MAAQHRVGNGCALTRVRVKVVDPALVNQAALKPERRQRDTSRRNILHLIAGAKAGAPSALTSDARHDRGALALDRRSIAMTTNSSAPIKQQTGAMNMPTPRRTQSRW